MLANISKSNEDLPFSTPPFFLNKEAGTWTCETCGVIKPKYLERYNRWLRQVCPCQIAAKERKEAEERRQAQIGIFVSNTYSWLGSGFSDESLAEKTFETFEKANQVTGYEAAELFTDILQGTLILHGPFGTGKTHLLAAICNRLRGTWKKSRFTTAPNLFRAIQECIRYDQDYNRIIRNASETPLLVLDDLDKAKWSEFREEIYFAIIDNRVKRGLPTAISTNRLDELANFVGGAVCSRLSISQVEVEMKGQDYRKLL